MAGERVRIVGDHPWRGESGTLVAVRNMGAAGEMGLVKLDRTEGIGGTDECYAPRENLRRLRSEEDPEVHAQSAGSQK